MRRVKKTKKTGVFTLPVGVCLHLDPLLYEPIETAVCRLDGPPHGRDEDETGLLSQWVLLKALAGLAALIPAEVGQTGIMKAVIFCGGRCC